MMVTLWVDQISGEITMTTRPKNSFYQLKGNIFIRVMEAPGKPPLEIPGRGRRRFLLSKHTRHRRSDRRKYRVVVEMPRPEGALDGFEWYCPNCHRLLHRAR